MKNNLLVIGDVHGKIEFYEFIVNRHNGKSIQVGDFGFSDKHEYHLKNINSDLHKINFGNHDDYTFLDKPHSLGNFSILTDEIMTVRGADSIDKNFRTENINWWNNEELSHLEMQSAIDVYLKHKPKIMITHDCPQSVREILFDIKDKSITSNGLQFMLEKHQPELWIFGHHHKSKNETINSTKFICLDELEEIII